VEVRLETTEGFAGQAEVWVDGTLLVVMDQYSRPYAPATPGVLDDATFTYLTDEGFTWSAAAAGNKAKRLILDPVKGWRYVGYGRVVQIMPVVIDFGLLAMEDANWTNDEKLIGRFVRVSIDRLTLTRAEDAERAEA
jgi:hypothetical protein